MTSFSNRKFVYAFLSVHGTVNVVNYDATNGRVNDFLYTFDGWGSKGIHKLSEDNNHTEFWFELTMEMWDMLHTTAFKAAFERMGVKLVFEYPY